MSDLVIRNVPDHDLELIEAEAEAQGQSVQEYLLKLLHREAAGANNRRVLAEVAARLERERPEPIPMEVIIAAKNDRD